MRVLVTGSRTWTDEHAIRLAMVDVHQGSEHDGNVLIVGGAWGADAIAERVARSWGWDVELYPAQWGQVGRSAGHKRNAEMVAAAPDVCLAFIKAESAGATGCVRMAEKAGVPVRVVRAS